MIQIPILISEITSVLFRSEVMCAAMALARDHEVYCYDGRQCVHGLFGEGPPPPLWEDEPAPWQCKTKRGNGRVETGPKIGLK